MHDAPADGTGRRRRARRLQPGKEKQAPKAGKNSESQNFRNPDRRATDRPGSGDGRHHHPSRLGIRADDEKSDDERDRTITSAAITIRFFDPTGSRAVAGGARPE